MCGWTAADDKDAERIQLAILASPLADLLIQRPDAHDVLLRHLPFYRHHRLAAIGDMHTDPPRCAFALVSDDAVVPLDGSLRPIYQVNELDPPQLDGDSAIAYTTFVLDHVITDTESRIRILTCKEANRFRDIWGEHCAVNGRALALAEDDDSASHVKGLVQAGDAILRADIRLDAEGHVALDTDSVVALTAAVPA